MPFAALWENATLKRLTREFSPASDSCHEKPCLRAALDRTDRYFLGFLRTDAHQGRHCHGGQSLAAVHLCRCGIFFDCGDRQLGTAGLARRTRHMDSNWNYLEFSGWCGHSGRCFGSHFSADQRRQSDLCDAASVRRRSGGEYTGLDVDVKNPQRSRTVVLRRPDLGHSRCRAGVDIQSGSSTATSRGAGRRFFSRSP